MVDVDKYILNHHSTGLHGCLQCQWLHWRGPRPPPLNSLSPLCSPSPLFNPKRKLQSIACRKVQTWKCDTHRNVPFKSLREEWLTIMRTWNGSSYTLEYINYKKWEHYNCNYKQSVASQGFHSVRALIGSWSLWIKSIFLQNFGVKSFNKQQHVITSKPQKFKPVQL